MRFLVCFKVVNDLDGMTPGEWDVAEMPCPDVGFTKRILSPFDEAALETALRLRDALGDTDDKVHLSALSLCDKEDVLDNITKNLYAVGFDEVHLLRCEGDWRFRPDAVAALLADNIISLEPFDLLFCGYQAGYGDNKQIPLRIAAKLGLHCVTQVKKVRGKDGGMLVQSQYDGGLKTQFFRRPLLLAMGNSEYSYLRVSTLREKMAASKRAVYEKDVVLNNETENVILETLYRPQLGRNCIFIEGENEQEKAQRFYAEYLKARLQV